MIFVGFNSFSLSFVHFHKILTIFQDFQSYSYAFMKVPFQTISLHIKMACDLQHLESCKDLF